jgi:hypothetical protein
MNWLQRLEAKHIPRLRFNKTYKAIKLVVLLPFLLPTVGVYKLIGYALGGIKIKRKTKPDIVLKNIVDGFANLAFPDPKTEEIALKRANICAKCPFAQPSGLYSMIIDNKTTQIQGMACNKCGCNLSAKVRSLNDYCPQGLW